MLCQVCRDGLEGIWDPSKTIRVCRRSDWKPNIIEGTQLDNVEYNDAIQIKEDLHHPKEWMFGHHVTKESLLESARIGCIQCNRCEPMDTEVANPMFAQIGWFSLFTVDLESTSPFNVTVYFLETSRDLMMIPHIDGDQDINLDIGPSTEGKQTWELVQHWLTQCLTSHEACNATATGGFFPTRLLELKNLTSPMEERKFRLVRGEQVSPEAMYITLSHCWGTGQWDDDQKLTESSYVRFLEYQPVERLPKKFSDAFTIIERLNIHYLWIDRYCIIQDSFDDWCAEASSMCDVYRHSFLNVSAMASADDTVGCFFTRDSSAVVATVFNLCVKGPSQPEPYRMLMEKGWAWFLSFMNEPLLGRGWTIQERLLAPRVLHFGRKQVYWECHGMSCCEVHPRSVDATDAQFMPAKEKARFEGGLHAWKHLLGSPARYNMDTELLQLLDDWDGILSLYTKCQLTVPGDKLVALSGIANDMKGRLAKLGCKSNKYHAGLWRCNFPQCLLWRTCYESKRATTYQAPSWSWAAVNGSIAFCNISQNASTTTIVASFVSVATIHNGEDTGQVTGGSLKFKGRLATAKLDLAIKGHFAYENRVALECIGSHFFDKTSETSLTTPSTNCSTIRGNVHFDTIDDFSENVLFLPILVNPKPKSWMSPSDTWQTEGLVLSRGENGTYTRIGIFCTENSESEEDAFLPFKELPDVEVEIL